MLRIAKGYRRGSLCFALAGLLLMQCQAVASDCVDFDPVCRPLNGLLLQQEICRKQLFGGSLQGCSPLELTGTVTTIAGSPGSSGSADGIGSAARLNNPVGITTDGTALYITEDSNHTVRRIDPATNTVTRLAGSPGSTGTADGPGLAARFNFPQGIAATPTTLYIADGQNHTVRALDLATNTVTTLAGTAGASGFTNDFGSAARFNIPVGIVWDGDQYLYVSESGNRAIRRIELATAAVTTVAGTGGSGSNDGPAATATFNQPYQMSFLGDPTVLFISDQNNNRLRRLDLIAQTVSTYSGSASGFVNGTLSSAQFSSPLGLTSDGFRLYVADLGNATLRLVNPDADAVSTLTGIPSAFAVVDGPADTASFDDLYMTTTDGTALYVVERFGHIVRKIE